MRVLRGRNVNELWRRGVAGLLVWGNVEESRNGHVYVAPHPVMSIYDRPFERVLFDRVRDANPFFHLFESLWMLAGRRDAAFLNRFVADFGERFAEPDGNIHGAYGHRWRDAFNFDQLDAVVEKLTVEPGTRQAVIAMWDPRDGELGPSLSSEYGMMDLTGDFRDRPCNTHIYLRVIPERQIKHYAVVDGVRQVDRMYGMTDVTLDLTVCCRSNDIMWGAYGANAVHFSFLQEYLAGRIGVEVGKLYQFSNNWHGYAATIDKYVRSSDEAEDWPGERDPYASGQVHPVRIGKDWKAWDEDLNSFMNWTAVEEPLDQPQEYPRNPWFHEVAEPMFAAHFTYKAGDKRSALAIAQAQIQATDWSRAAAEWIQRRIK